MSAIDFVRETAIFMANDRPDLYTAEAAVDELWEQIEALRDMDMSFGFVSFASYYITREWDEGVESFTFLRKISGYLLCEEEEDSRAFSYDVEMNLPHILDAFGDD